MHCTLRRTSTIIPEEADRESNFLSRKFIEKDNLNSSAKDSSEVTSVGWQNLDRRCAVYLWTPEPDGQWKLVALPVGHVYHVNQRGSTTPAISVNSSQSRNRGTGNTFLVTKEEKSKKRNSRKKTKKKGKHKKTLSREIGLTGSESVPQCGASQTGDNNDVHNGVVPLASAIKLADSPPENCGNEFSSEGTSTRCYPCTSCIEEAGVSESLTPMHPNSSSDHHISEFGDGIPTAGVQNIHCGVVSNPNICSDRPILDSPSLGSNCKKLNSDYRFTLCDEKTNVIDNLNTPDCVARDGCPGDSFHDTVTSDIHNQKTNYSRQLCHSEMLENKVNKIKRSPQNSSVCSFSSVGNLHGPSGRGTNHAVWQKVQNNEACKRNHDLRNVNTVFSQFDNELKEASTHEKHIHAVCSSLKSDSVIKKRANTKVSAKMKKNDLGSKQEFKYYYRNGSQVANNSDLCTSINRPQNELCAIPKHTNGEFRPNIDSRSHSKSKFATSGFQTRRIESIRLRPPESSQDSPNEAEPLESGCATTFSVNDQNVDIRTCYSLTSCSSLNTPELHEMQSAIQLHTLVDHKEAIADKKDSLAPSDHKKDSSSGALCQKWIPIGLRNSGSNGSSVHGGLSLVKIDEPDGESMVKKNSIEEGLVSDSHGLVCAASSGSICKGPSSDDVNSPPLKNVAEVNNFGNQCVSVVKEYSNSTKYCTPESSSQRISTPDNNSSKLLSAVIDSYKAQVASEAIQLATGCPVAEFEKLLHSASPVICTSPTTVSCQTCSRDSVCAFLCQHEVPNISLGELWQWYEKHGSYGLEVKADDYENSCRLGIDSVTFRAYFVPFLSAVQLFTKSKVLHSDNDNGISASSAIEKGEMVESSEISNFSHLLSLLVPQPRTQDCMLSPDDHVCSEPSAGSITEDVFVSPAHHEESNELEVLFEYFESEQPQKRRPIYEMIDDLVRGNVSSRCRVHGDGTILNSASICDLHPKSWYSVAWYPIYRIPEGNFRATFLTYHSLGHLVQKQPASGSACMDVSVVTPVVGLQTYNAQGECWFQPRHSACVLNSDPGRILKERLRTLELTASLMARASVTKGNMTTVNRQPDYEFFLSRQRC